MGGDIFFSFTVTKTDDGYGHLTKSFTPGEFMTVEMILATNVRLAEDYDQE